LIGAEVASDWVVARLAVHWSVDAERRGQHNLRIAFSADVVAEVFARGTPENPLSVRRLKILSAASAEKSVRGEK